MIRWTEPAERPLPATAAVTLTLKARLLKSRPRLRCAGFPSRRRSSKERGRPPPPAPGFNRTVHARPQKSLRLFQRPQSPHHAGQGDGDQRPGAGDFGPVGRGSARQDRRVQGPLRPGRDPGIDDERGLRRSPRGVKAAARRASLRRADGRRHGAAQRRHRRDAHRRGQDPGRHPAGLSQRHRRQGRAPDHRQRLSRRPRRRMDGADLHLPRPVSGSHRQRPVAGRASAGLRLRHHLWHQ